MPTYDYRCEDCGHEFEYFQSMKDDVLKDCPECKEPKLRRLIGTGAGIIFKGSGFYETDYKRSRSPSESSPSEKKSETKTETKSSESKSDSSSSTSKD